MFPTSLHMHVISSYKTRLLDVGSAQFLNGLNRNGKKYVSPKAYLCKAKSVYFLDSIFLSQEIYREKGMMKSEKTNQAVQITFYRPWPGHE